jgi:osmotically-inducible protein OsmY
MHYQTGQGSSKRNAGTARQVADVVRQAEQRLKNCPYQELRDIICDYHEGVLTLRGRVNSFYLKQMAQTVVAKIDGVDECVNRIEVRPPRHGQR